MAYPTREQKLARSFAQEWLRPNDPDAATPALVDTLSTAMLAFLACVNASRDTLVDNFVERTVEIRGGSPNAFYSHVDAFCKAWVR